MSARRRPEDMSDRELAEASRLTLLNAVTEKAFQAQVVAYARAMGWRVHYNTIAYRSPDGWPDLFMVRGPRVVTAELKTMKGKTKPPQDAWAVAFIETPIEHHLWRPSDWDEIERVLGR